MGMGDQISPLLVPSPRLDLFVMRPAKDDLLISPLSLGSLAAQCMSAHHAPIWSCGGANLKSRLPNAGRHSKLGDDWMNSPTNTMNKLIITSLVSLAGIISSSAEWYDQLQPGVNRLQIHEVAGQPTTATADSERYNLPQGYLVLKFNREILEDCQRYGPTFPDSLEYLYATFDGTELSAAQAETRRKYLSARNFAVLPQFDGPWIRASGQQGRCYPVDDSFIIIEEIIYLMGGQGFFADKAALVVLRDKCGVETVLYRAFDHWASLRPPRLTLEEASARTTRLRDAGLAAIGKPVGSILGHCDSVMGSGVSYRLYYLTNGLAIADAYGDDDDTANLARLSIAQPGKKVLEFANWIEEERQATRAEDQLAKLIFDGNFPAVSAPRDGGSTELRFVGKLRWEFKDQNSHGALNAESSEVVIDATDTTEYQLLYADSELPLKMSPKEIAPILQEIEGKRISAAYALEPQIRLEEKGRIRMTARRLVFHTTMARPVK
jgi:hypothetical protein